MLDRMARFGMNSMLVSNGGHLVDFRRPERAKQPQPQAEGRSLLPLINAPDADWPDRYLFTHQGR